MALLEANIGRTGWVVKAERPDSGPGSGAVLS